MIAGPRAAPFQVRSDVRVFDARIGSDVHLRPPVSEPGRHLLLYVYAGKVFAGHEVISEGESVLATAADFGINGLVASDVVLSV